MSIAGCPVPTEGADPPDWSNNLLPVSMPEVTSETKIPSMLASVRFVFSKVRLRSPLFILSKRFNGKLASDVQFFHVLSKLVPFDVSSNGKLVSELH